jgi:hypothetical protein
MHRKQAQVDPTEAHDARLAWWAAFVTTVVLALAIGFVHTADAATLPPSPLGLPRALVVEPEEAEEDEEEAEACEETSAEEEAGEGEEELGEEVACESVETEDEDESPPAQCRLESSDAAVSADLVHRKLHLAVRYTAFKPSLVTVSYFLRGGKGPLTLPAEHKRFGRSGVFRVSEELTAAQAKKVAAARSFTVQVRPAGAPGYCREYLDEELTVRRGGQSGPIWTSSSARWRPGRDARGRSGGRSRTRDR